MAGLISLSPTVASRQCVPILADEIYGDMVSVSCSPLNAACPFWYTGLLAMAARCLEVSDSSTPLYCGWVHAWSSQSSGVQSWGYHSCTAPFLFPNGSLSWECTYHVHTLKLRAFTIHSHHFPASLLVVPHAQPHSSHNKRWGQP